MAVGLGSDQCHNAPIEVWDVFTLQPRPDGTLAGEYSGTSSGGCSGKGTVTFARTGSIDVNTLPDPAALPPRVVSPAAALRGHYQLTRNFTNGSPQQDLVYDVTTDCLRTGDRCMSYFHSPSDFRPLVFGDGNWTSNIEFDGNCPPPGGPTHLKFTAQYPMPEPASRIRSRCSSGTVARNRPGPAQPARPSPKHSSEPATSAAAKQAFYLHQCAPLYRAESAVRFPKNPPSGLAQSFVTANTGPQHERSQT